ncbi:DUF928 domain-containing protein [Synechococcus sp. PCC 7335]|uniref:DUF928 domain-containing protein n=1 Tax=Synechococcus sp. (strain ATCC 29403 / PCC 7335) TaxID=91464 RepID=UPI0018DE6B31|nr:DUF928 domain-containing protein [Synechococcus sp. PCC 7335]
MPQLFSRHLIPLKISLFAIFLLSSQLQRPQKSAAQAARFPDQIVFWEGFEPPGDDAPRETSGAGSRDGPSCDVSEPAVKALMPKSNFGLTLSERPTVFAQLADTSAEQVALVVTNEAGTYYEQTFLPIPEDDTAAFTFPNSFSPLTVGENYQWSLVVICEETVQPDDPVISGWVQRVESTPELQQASLHLPLEQARWYAENGYWYDFVAFIREEIQTLESERISPPSEAVQFEAIWESVVEASL